MLFSWWRVWQPAERWPARQGASLPIVIDRCLHCLGALQRYVGGQFVDRVDVGLLGKAVI